MVVAGEVEAVQLLEGLPARSEPWVGVEERFETGPVGVCEGVASLEQSEPGPEHVGLESGLDTRGLSTLDIAAHRGETGREPSDHMEPVQHVAGMSEAGVDGGLVGPRPVGDHDLDLLVPLVALLRKERRQRSAAAVRDHREGLAGVGVDDHGHIAVPSADGCLIDQQHTAALAAAARRDDVCPGPHQRVDAVPAHWLFPDELFGDLFESGRGRPSVPGEVVASVMVLQALEGLSDRAACLRLQTDVAWKAAAGLALTDEAFHPTVLVLWRNRLRASPNSGEDPVL